MGSNPTLSARLVTICGVPDAARQPSISHAVPPALAPTLRSVLSETRPMFIGHFALGFAARRAAPRPSLTTLITAAIFLDILWPLFLWPNPRAADHPGGAHGRLSGVKCAPPARFARRRGPW